MFIDCHMTEFASAATGSVVQFAINKNRCSNSLSAYSYVTSVHNGSERE